jgi:hypothetical protein
MPIPFFQRNIITQAAGGGNNTHFPEQHEPRAWRSSSEASASSSGRSAPRSASAIRRYSPPFALVQDALAQRAHELRRFSPPDLLAREIMHGAFGEISRGQPPGMAQLLRGDLGKHLPSRSPQGKRAVNPPVRKLPLDALRRASSSFVTAGTAVATGWPAQPARCVRLNGPVAASVRSKCPRSGRSVRSSTRGHTRSKS